MPDLFAVGEIISAFSEAKPVRIGRPFPSFQMLHPRRRVRRRRRGDRKQGATKGRREGSPGNRSVLRRSIRKDRYETHDHPHWRDRAPCDPCCCRRCAERLCTGDRPVRSERRGRRHSRHARRPRKYDRVRAGCRSFGAGRHRLWKRGQGDGQRSDGGRLHRRCRRNALDRHRHGQQRDRGPIGCAGLGIGRGPRRGRDAGVRRRQCGAIEYRHGCRGADRDRQLGGAQRHQRR